MLLLLLSVHPYLTKQEAANLLEPEAGTKARPGASETKNAIAGQEKTQDTWTFFGLFGEEGPTSSRHTVTLSPEMVRLVRGYATTNSRGNAGQSRALHTRNIPVANMTKSTQRHALWEYCAVVSGQG